MTNTDSASTSRAPGEEGPSSSSSSSSSPSDKKSKRPPESRFLQQNLPACKPLLTPGWVMSIYLLVGLIFIPIGVFALMASNSVVEIVERYDASCVPSRWAKNEVQYIQNDSINKLCTRKIMVPKLMDPPIFVYYELDGFYQNHRRYVKSRSDGQLLHGSEATDTSSCKPELYLQNNANRTIVPCGLIAWSLFNDTYNFSANTEQIPVNKKGIAWKSDREHRFGDKVYPQNFPNNVNETGVLIGGGKLNTTEPLDEDEDLMVWMRTAALPNFRKLYGRIEQPLKANMTITIDIHNVYNTYSFGGQKKVVLSTATWVGGKNDFLGIAYITIGSLCILLAMVFFVVHITHRRPLGDVNYLSWNRQRAD